MAEKKTMSPVEQMLWKYATDIVGEERMNTMIDEKYWSYWKYGGICLLVFFLVFGSLGRFISNIVGFVYPAYSSIRALESSSKADDSQWLTYWVVYASFTLVDTFSGFLLSWIPFYWLAKVVFLVWCFSPNELNGSVVIYKQVILPFFMKHEQKLNKAVKKMGGVVNNISNEANKITENIRTDI